MNPEYSRRSIVFANQSDSVHRDSAHRSVLARSGDLARPGDARALPTEREMMVAFADFLQMEVSNGDATDDTVTLYWNEVRMFLEWCKARHLPPMAATRRDIVTLRDELKRRGMAPATRAKKISVIRRFYASALREGWIQTNPADNVRGGKDPTPPEEKIKALTLDALGEMIQAMPRSRPLEKRDCALVALMALHGLRRIEVHRLNHESITLDGESAFLAVWGKGNKVRRVYLRADVWGVLREWLEAKLRLGLALSGALFVALDHSNYGGRISRRSLNKIVDRHLDESGLKRDGVSCHALRHTAATLSLAGGAKIEHLRDALGHADLSTTSIYVAAVERRKHNPANFIDARFEASPQKAASQEPSPGDTKAPAEDS